MEVPLERGNGMNEYLTFTSRFKKLLLEPFPKVGFQSWEGRETVESEWQCLDVGGVQVMVTVTYDQPMTSPLPAFLCPFLAIASWTALWSPIYQLCCFSPSTHPVIPLTLETIAKN